MRILQDTLEKTLHSLPVEAASALIVKKLAAQGLKLSTRQLDLLKEHVIRGGSDTLLLQSWRWWEQGHVTLEFTPEDIEHIERTFKDFVENHLPELIQKAAADLSRSILANLKKRWRAESRRLGRDSAGFRKRLYDRWQAPLEGLRMLLTISRELGDTINHDISESPDDAIGGEHLIGVLAAYSSSAAMQRATSLVSRSRSMAAS
jgi:hypothetical protein